MVTITTAHILADKVLQKSCGQECVDWAVSMLEQGRDGHYLVMLAGLTSPLNQFEIADYRDRSLRELGITGISDDVAINNYVAECLRHALAGEIDLFTVLCLIKNLCIARYYPKAIYDFYLLYFAYVDLQESGVQWYWADATRKNIVSIIRERAEAFLKSREDG